MFQKLFHGFLQLPVLDSLSHFLWPHLQHAEVLGPRVKSEQQLGPTPEPHQIWATSVTYATAFSHTGSLILRARPGIEPLSLQILVGFVSGAQQWKLPFAVILISPGMNYLLQRISGHVWMHR